MGGGRLRRGLRTYSMFVVVDDGGEAGEVGGGRLGICHGDWVSNEVCIFRGIFS